MAFEYFPTAPSVTLSLPDSAVPPDVHAWLQERGYAIQTTVDGENYYVSPDRDGLYYTWSECMALEFFRFINVGREQ